MAARYLLWGYILLLALYQAVDVRAQVLFEDNFQLVARPEWQPLYGEWTVLDRRFVVIRNDYPVAIALLNIPRPQNFAVEVEWDGSGRIIVVLSYHDPSRYLRFACGESVGYGLETLPGKDAVTYDRRGCHIKPEGNKLRVEVRGYEISANVNNSAAWQWKATLTGGRIGVGISNGVVRIRRYRVIALDGDSTVASEPPTGAAQPSPSLPSTSSAPPAPFTIDPQDIDALARQLADACLSESAPRRISPDASVAIATFDLVDVPSPSISKNVVEDLHTSMVVAGFKLVERGQISKIMRELQIQSTTAINPATAQKLGQLLGAQYLLVGSVSDRGTFVVTNARLLDVSTGRTVAAARVEMRKVLIERTQ